MALDQFFILSMKISKGFIFLYQSVFELNKFPSHLVPILALGLSNGFKLILELFNRIIFVSDCIILLLELKLSILKFPLKTSKLVMQRLVFSVCCEGAVVRVNILLLE